MKFDELNQKWSGIPMRIEFCELVVAAKIFLSKLEKEKGRYWLNKIYSNIILAFIVVIVVVIVVVVIVIVIIVKVKVINSSNNSNSNSSKKKGNVFINTRILGVYI